MNPFDPASTALDTNRQNYLSSIGIPRGLISSISHNLRSCDLRLWLIDNSSSMLVRDSHCIGGNWDCIEKIDGASRWDELKDCVAFQAEMTARCWIPTKFCLVNDPQSNLTPQKFSLCCNSPNDLSSEMNQIKQIMLRVTPQFPQNQLTTQIQNIHGYISREAPRLVSQGKIIDLIICTQGLPTDNNGNAGPAIVQEFKQAIYSLSQLPVKIVIRLCTDDERAVDFYNTLDCQLDSLDVLDDYWGEALEVYLHNPWLTYGLGLHRLREAGMAWILIDYVDERPLTMDELYTFCKSFLLGQSNGCGMTGVELPDPRTNWNMFLQGLSKLLEKERQQWNPVLGRLAPWINVTKLNSMYGGVQQQFHYHQQPQYAPQSNPNRTSVPFPIPTSTYATKQSQQSHPNFNHTPMPQQQFSQQPQPNSYSETKPCPVDPKTHCIPPQSKSAANVSTANTNSSLKQQILRQWALQSPQYKTFHPLPHLLVTVPMTFKLDNVEHHKYFGKWKPFTREAFGDGAQEEVLKRAVRKAKLFLHPDKLPKDLTHNQSLLFETLWNVIRDSWEALGV